MLGNQGNLNDDVKTIFTSSLSPAIAAVSYDVEHGRIKSHTLRATAITLPADDHTTIHLRTTTQTETRQKQLYGALNIKSNPIGKCKTILDNKKSVVPFEIK